MNAIANIVRRFNNGTLLFMAAILAALVGLLLEISLPQGDSIVATMIFFIQNMLAVMSIVTIALLLMLSTRSLWHDTLFEGVTNIYSSRKTFSRLAAFSAISWMSFYLAYPPMTANSNYQQAVTDQVPAFAMLVIITLLSSILALIVNGKLGFGFNSRDRSYGLFSLLMGICAAVFIALYEPPSEALTTTNILSFGLLGFAGLVFVYGLIKKYLPFGQMYNYQVVEVDALSDGVTEVVMRPISRAIPYLPGQYSWVSFFGDNISKEAHPYVFASGNNGPYVRFSIRGLGDYTKKISDLQRGARARLEGPYGGFDYMNSSLPYQVWIAGDLGVTPFVSMARSLSPRFNKQVTIVYVVPEPTNAIFYKELSEIEKITGGRLKVVPIIESVTGQLNEKFLRSFTPDIMATEYYICGPSPMISGVKSILKSAGVEYRYIQSQDFQL